MTKIRVKCLTCNKSFLKRPCELKKRNFCSRPCFWKYPPDWSKGESNYHWIGRFRMGYKKRYIGLRIHGHPMADKHGRILEHRYIASQKLGRILERSEVVHHINHDYSDNRPENLKVMSHSEHSKHHTTLMHTKRKLIS